MSSTESLQSSSSVWDNRSMWSNRSCPLEEEALRLPLAVLYSLIFLDRYLKIMGSHRGRRWLRGRSWSLVTCGLLWGLSVLMAVPMMALAEGNEEPGKCYQYKQRKHARGKAYFNLLMVAVFWLVFVVLLVSYGQIARRLLRASQDKPHLPNAARYARTARKSFVVPLLFTVCFVPYHAFRGFYVASQLQDISCETRRLMDRTNEAVLLLSALNSCLDPVMYFLLSGSVRRATLQALAQCLRLHAEPPATNSSTTELRRTSVSHASTTAVLDTSRCSLGNITTLRSQHTDLHPHSEPCVHRSGLSD